MVCKISPLPLTLAHAQSAAKDTVAETEFALTTDVIFSLIFLVDFFHS